jgi:vacuolar-type H+-ATPase subunit E/Vma4
MAERSGERRDIYVPPTPENTKPKASRDNSVEMAAGSESERAALETQREKMAQPSGATTDPGRTDNPHGTGVGYAGVGSTAYGTQEADMSTGDQKHAGEGGHGAPVQRRQPEQQHQQQHPSPSQKSGGGDNGGTQQSTGSKPPTQGTGSTPQSHTSSNARPQRDPQGTQGGTSTVTPTTSQTAPGAMGGTQGHNASQVDNAGTFVQSHGGASGASGQGAAAHAEQKADDSKETAHDTAHGLKDAAQDKAQEVKDQAQSKSSDAKEQAETALAGMKDQAAQRVDDARSQAQGRLGAVTTQAQDRLESVRANVQTTRDQLRETVTGKTDQLKGTVGDTGEQVKQAANEKSTQAGEKLTGLAGTLREKAEPLGAESPVANVATKAAGALEQTGTYLQGSTPDDWMGDLKQLISRKPFESVLVAAGLGYMAARAFKK